MTDLIDKPGIYQDVPEDAYHADTAVTFGPTLSASGAKTLLRSPRRFDWERAHGGRSTSTMDFGTLVHTLVLRSHDQRIAVLPFKDLRTKAAQEADREARAAGRIPVLAKDVRRAIAVAKAVRAHPLAGAILSDGHPEVSLYWPSEVQLEDGSSHVVMCRGRIDWLRPDAIVDLKTVSRAGACEVSEFSRQAASLDYPVSAAHYVDGWAALTGGQVLPFLTITVETEAPHFVTVSQYGAEDLAAGRARMESAKQEFARRSLSGEWEDPPTIHTLTLPAWYAYAV